MGRRHPAAAGPSRTLRVVLPLVASLALVASFSVPVSAALAAHPAATGLASAPHHQIARSLGHGAHVDARAAARAAAVHPRPARAPLRRHPNLGARPATRAAVPSPTGFDPETSTRTATVSPSPRIVAQPAPVVTTQFAGISQTQACSCEPPDPWIAVSPTDVVQTTNGLIRVTTRTGVARMSTPTWALFAVPPDRTDTDPRIIWDAVHARWVGVLATYTSGFTATSLQLAISDGADPTAAWSVYDIQFGAFLPDFPGISSSSTRIVLTSNDFHNGDVFTGPTFLELDWANVLAGTDLFVGGMSFSNTAIGGFRPAIMLSSAANTPVIYEAGDHVGYFEVAGTAHAPTTVALRDLTQDLGIAPFTLPPAPVQAGGAAITEAVDERPTDAVFRNGLVWFPATADFFDGTNHWDAGRWTRVRTDANGSGATSAIDRFASVSGSDIFMPGVGVNADGSAIFVATTSGPSAHPATVIGAFLNTGTGVPLTTVEASTAAYTGARWGDFVGVAADPAGNGAVWIAHELVSSTGSWRTSVIRVVSDATPPTVPGAVSQAQVVPQTLTGSVSVRTSWGPATDADSGVRGYLVEVSTDAGPFLGAETVGTSITQRLLLGHTYRYRVRAVDAVGLVGPASVGPTYRPTLFQSTTSTTYAGSWGTHVNAVFSGGSSRFSSSTGASATFTATLARSIAFVTTQATTRGSFRVYVDGVLKATVNPALSTTIYRRILYQASWPTAGTHTVKIVVSGTAGHPRVDVDAFVVLR